MLKHIAEIKNAKISHIFLNVLKIFIRFLKFLIRNY